ncbi:MAG: IS110 family transposase [Chloroflexi bacterium]|nr:IS110 family transposase [Chloroflexota bacterium]
MFYIIYKEMKKVCGLDVHKDTIFLCILAENGQTFLKEYSTLTPDIESMRDLIKEQQVSEVAMESTGIYWIPLWRILQGHVEMKLVNPFFIKQLPGRKTDVKDSQWIATVLQKGLIRGSYIPGQHIQELRQYERRYVRICEHVTRLEQAIDRQLHRCNIRITNFTSKVGSASVMGVVRGLIKGESTPDELIKHIHGRITNKHKEKIAASLQGFVSDSDRFIFRQNYEELELLTRQQQECVKEMENICDTLFKEELKLLCSVPGIQKLSAMTIIAELGVDLKTFLTAASLVGWVGLRPRNDESAKKIKSRKITNGNKYLRRILVQCAWAITRSKTCWLSDKFNELAKRRSQKKALIAIARKLLVIIWHVLSKHEEYKEYKPKLSKEQKQKRIARLEKQILELQS